MLDLRLKEKQVRFRPTELFKPRAAADCSECPCAWEDMSCEGECYDCGCVASKHMTGKSPICRLPMWVKRLIRKRADAKRDKTVAREHEDMTEWFMECERKNNAMLQAITETFPGFIPGHDGADALRRRYEEILKEKRNATQQP